MPDRLSNIGSNPTIREYAQGAAQRAVQPVADFLAPAVSVAVSVGKYKIYTAQNQFKVPETRRAIGGRAVEIGWDASDGTYNCEPHALDVPVDRLEQLEQADLENAMMEASDLAAEVGGLAHEKAVIDAAVAALGAGTDKTWDSSADPVDDLDEQILNVIKAAKYGSLMGVRILFGAGAWRIFKNQSSVRGRFIVGNRTRGATQTPTVDTVGQLFVSQPQVRQSFMVYDTTKEGVAESISFLLNNKVLIYACKDVPTRRDPSFMKTFRLRGQWMVPGTYSRDDQRVDVAKFDWSEDVKVTNSSAGVMLNVSDS